MQSNSPPVRKMSTSLIIFVACILGLGIGLFTLNYWHTSQCSTDKSAAEIDEMIEALNRRVLQTESQVQRNEVLVNKVIQALQANLMKLEQKEYDTINSQSKDEAVRIALYLAKHPAPPMPIFPMAEEYLDTEKLADLIDDVYGKAEAEEKEDYLDVEESKEEVTEVLAVTDAEATLLCTEWKEKYNVAIGVSWGDLPYELQQKWLAYSCDYHMKDDKEDKKGEEEGFAI